MDNVIPIDLRSRLLRLHHNEQDVDVVLKKLGATATMEKSLALLNLVLVSKTLREHSSGINADFIDTVLRNWRSNMARNVGLYDSKCFDIAEAFLSDEEDYEQWSPELQRERASMLASHIQETIESWLQYELGVLREGKEP